MKKQNDLDFAFYDARIGYDGETIHGGSSIEEEILRIGMKIFGVLFMGTLLYEITIVISHIV